MYFILCFIAYLDCPQLESPADGKLSTTTLIYGTKVILECKNGYTAFGETKTTCQDGGVWSPILADCKQGMSCVTTFEVMGLRYIL